MTIATIISNSTSVSTTSIEGVKMDIREVNPSHYEHLSKMSIRNSSKPAARFFLLVNDNYIVRYKHAENFYLQTNQFRFDLFCLGKIECIEYISIFEKEASFFKCAAPKTPEGCEKLSARKDRINAIFGTTY